MRRAVGCRGESRRRGGLRLVAVAWVAMLVAPGLARGESPATSPVPPVEQERDVVEVAPTMPVTLVHVDNRLGDVRIEGHDGPNLIIAATKRAVDTGTLERLTVSLVPDPNGPVRVSTAISPGAEARPIPAGSVRVDLIIRAPRSARVEAQVWNGRLTVIGMENGAELAVNQGAIDVQNVSGTIVTHAAAGTQQFVEVFGVIDAQAIAGDMSLDVVRGQRLEASVHEGRIDGRKVRVREVSIRAIKGDIRFHGQALAGGRYQIGTYRGNVEVALARTAPLAVWAYAAEGEVVVPHGLETQADARGGMRMAVSSEDGQPAVVELRSRVGTIRFAVVE